jgi:outer membrane protein TolC
MRIVLLSIVAVTGSAAVPGRLHARQETGAADTLRLGALQASAIARDPRDRQVELLASQSAVRVRSIGTEWLPRIDAAAQAQYQSEVVSLPFDPPGGASAFAPPHDTYDAYVRVRQPLLDPALGARRSIERARLAESQAGVRSTLFALRQSVADAFFAVLSLDAQRAELETALGDIEAQLRVARQRVEAGDALPGEAMALEAERLRRRQSLAGIAVEQAAARAVLADLTGEATGERPLALPELAGAVSRARAGADVSRATPEHARFAGARSVLAAESASLGRRAWPRLSAVGRAGAGRPGLNPLGDSFGSYWLAALQLEWTPFDWGRTRLDRQALAIQREIVASEEAAFTDGIRRRAVRDLAAIDRLEAALTADDAIIPLREAVLRETRARFSEGVVTSATFVDRETDLLSARIARAIHRVELAEARARYLTLLGLELD